MSLPAAVVYLRVSTVEQAKRGAEPEGYSIPAQREACQREAERLEAEITAEFVDRGASARSADRPQLKALLAHLQEHSVRYVIVHKIDRLARNLADHVEITLAIREAGAELVSVTENVDDTPLGEYMQTIFAANAQLYSANLASEARKGLHAKAKLGGTPGRAPLGYLNVRELIDGREVRTVRVDPERAPHIQWAFTAYASGGYTLDTLCSALERRGLVTRPTPTKPPRPVSRSSLANLLGNPYYVGTIRYGGVEYEGRHERLVDGDTFARVQAIRAAHDNAKERERKHRHYLKGSLLCGECGGKLTFARGHGNGGTYSYFACIGRIRGTGCRQPYVPVETVEEKVAGHYVEVDFTGDRSEWHRHLDKAREKLNAALHGLHAENERQARAQKARLAKIEEERDKLLAAFYADAIPVEQLKREQDRLRSEAHLAEEALGAAEKSAHELGEILSMALDLLEHCADAYESAPPQLRRQWNQALFTPFVVKNDGEVEADLTEPFATLADPALPTRLGSPGRRRHSTARVRSAHSVGRGSNKEVLVGATGFEPATFRPPVECATRLRHAPSVSNHAARAARARAGRARGPGDGKRATGLEPALRAWKALVQPLHHARA